jgi:hypothetical protein
MDGVDHGGTISNAWADIVWSYPVRNPDPAPAKDPSEEKEATKK